MKAKIFSQGRITIPKVIREQLGLKPGTILEFDANAGYLKAKVSSENRSAAKSSSRTLR